MQTRLSRVLGYGLKSGVVLSVQQWRCHWHSKEVCALDDPCAETQGCQKQLHSLTKKRI